MFTDPIADMLTRIRNASAVKKAEVLIPFSKVKLSIANILLQAGFLKSVEKVEDGRGDLKIILKYQDGRPVLTSLTRISKPGRRIYIGKEDLKTVRNGLGISILSTSQGIMDGREAKKKNIGGELICEVY
ncbi:MAG: 30S ribosomal protein S8 [Candidatus Magasanikbacteria bacterium GW2011_GWC2_40_17]|uniref:Small ribosomal subunit protein uS8 n=1 Tax=Candidatus Magasanikbacteria bacterium GW2011_GWA2_42_32 TaxID=1619039 RepID=A0A0G1A6Z2_9BACT|nr:MAG: 30S ribosomal protein S8 [Candidatus Magasanikbacteria bacterium GW2011_GWC2_40_17]KKS56790.1 MAG: 30S ribosomal protein S8 [Candidatus Magasanikbacteria bacterium GW2011_GWA2_42_32]OGH86024.1 MAG: 30S ribosomal protein S8 [Candidatus Magasanikbacteria bacterium RIFOXYB2_FULL_38_10]